MVLTVRECGCQPLLHISIAGERDDSQRPRGREARRLNNERRRVTDWKTRDTVARDSLFRERVGSLLECLEIVRSSFLQLAREVAEILFQALVVVCLAAVDFGEVAPQYNFGNLSSGSEEELWVGVQEQVSLA